MESLVLKLLKEKPDLIRAKDSIEGRTALHFAALNGHLGLARMLIEHGADVQAEDKEKMTPLHCACFQDSAAIPALLLQKGAHVNARGMAGFTPLHLAASQGKKEVMEILLNNGADINSKTESLVPAGVNIYSLLAAAYPSADIFPLHLAAQSGSPDAVRVLLKHGVDINVKDGKGQTPIDWAVKQGRIKVTELLLDKGAQLNNSLLTQAAQNGDMNMVELLLARGADVNRKNFENRTPIEKAVFFNRAEVVKILVNKGAAVNIKGEMGWTPLHTAASNGFKEIVAYLLASGADVNARERNGTTPLHYAVLEGIGK
jgi:cytohesin